MNTKTQDYTAVFQDMMGAFKLDPKAMEALLKTNSQRVEQISAVTFDAMSKSTELSAQWTQDMLAKVAALTAAKTDPSDLAKSFSEFAASTAEAATAHLTSYADIVKKAQSDALELIMAAGKDVTQDVEATTQKAQAELKVVAEKAQAQIATSTKAATV
jgi:hypothetical protein